MRRGSLGVLVGVLAVSGAIAYSRLEPSAPPSLGAGRGLGCAEVVGVAWGEAERALCAAELSGALAEAAAELGCEGGVAPPLRPGDRLRLERGAGRSCLRRLERLPGRALLALGLPIDLNMATPADLRALPGVGVKRAQRIVALRRALGGFSEVEELEQVRGIGPKTLARLRPSVTVRPR